MDEREIEIEYVAAKKGDPRTLVVKDINGEWYSLTGEELAIKAFTEAFRKGERVKIDYDVINGRNVIRRMVKLEDLAKGESDVYIATKRDDGLRDLMRECYVDALSASNWSFKDVEGEVKAAMINDIGSTARTLFIARTKGARM